MSLFRMAVAAAALVLTSTAVSAQDQLFHRKGSVVPTVDQTLTPEQIAQIPQLPQTPSCTPGVAISARGNAFGTSGADHVLTYPTNDTNEGGAWIGNTILEISGACSGLYHLEVQFEKDSFYTNCNGSPGPLGTQDDVSIYFRNLSLPGFPVLGSQAGAWSGEGDGRRGTGAYGLVVRLHAGDTVSTWVHSDGGYFRCLAVYTFAAYRIGP